MQHVRWWSYHQRISYRSTTDSLVAHHSPTSRRVKKDIGLPTDLLNNTFVGGLPTCCTCLYRRCWATGCTVSWSLAHMQQGELVRDINSSASIWSDVNVNLNIIMAPNQIISVMLDIWTRYPALQKQVGVSRQQQTVF